MAKGYRQSVEPYDGFDAEFNQWVHAGADPELVALVGPLLAGKLDGGSEEASTAASEYLTRQAREGAMRDADSMARARSEGRHLLAQYGLRENPDLIRQYAPGEAVTEQLFEQQGGGKGRGAFKYDLPAHEAASELAPLPERPVQPERAGLGNVRSLSNEPVDLANKYATYGPRPFWEYDT